MRRLLEARSAKHFTALLKVDPFDTGKKAKLQRQKRMADQILAWVNDLQTRPGSKPGWVKEFIAQAKAHLESSIPDQNPVEWARMQGQYEELDYIFGGGIQEDAKAGKQTEDTDESTS